MDDLVELHGRALADFDALVAAIGDDDWSRRTACEAWTVRDLLTHMTAESLWAPHLMRGETLAAVGDRYDGDVLGDDPHAAWRAAADGEREAVAAPGALDRRVHTTMGLLPATEYVMQRITDLAVHRWDLARGLGTDAAVPDDVAEWLCGQWEPQIDAFAGSGLFAPPVPVGADASPSDRLLGLLGRRP